MCDKIQRQMPSIAHSSQHHTSICFDSDPSYTAIVNAHPQPALWRELQSPVKKHGVDFMANIESDIKSVRQVFNSQIQVLRAPPPP
jgi:hypothetical protein